MAALNTIAREYTDEIRDGIAWVIVWKTGRSWNATAVWLNPDDDTFEPDNLTTVREVLEQDPNAVMVNGYYCGHFGEDMTVAELADGIRWHYENGYNTLENSTAFPPEPVERPADLPANTPWYELPTAEAPDPYIYDGHMSPEDFERRHELMELEPKPPDSMKLEITIGPEQSAAIAQTINKGLERAAQALREFAEWAADVIGKVAAVARKTVDNFVDSLLYRANNHPKWWHLYKHAKKARTRKEYRRRLMQQLTEKLAVARAGPLSRTGRPYF